MYTWFDGYVQVLRLLSYLFQFHILSIQFFPWKSYLCRIARNFIIFWLYYIVFIFFISCLQISEYLFRKPNKTEGGDLVSLDLARGRDFGLPSYNKFRQLCGLSEARTFDDFTDQMSKKVGVQNFIVWIGTVFWSIFTFFWFWIFFYPAHEECRRLGQGLRACERCRLLRCRHPREPQTGRHSGPYVPVHRRRDVFPMEVWRPVLLRIRQSDGIF